VTIKLLRARYVAGRGYLFRVHLDITKMLEDGATPDPDWVRVWTYGEAPPPGKTVAQYRDMIREQTRTLALAEAAEKAAAADEGTALPQEGAEI
jgi:hypothetical protein